MICLNKNYLPFFSVIITTYNRKDILPRAINSLKWQTEEDWEGIIIDDGSDDKSSDYCIDLVKSDKRFRYTLQQNRGVAAAKNLGIMNSTGLYTTFLDSDDEYKQDHLERRKLLFNQNPEIELLHGGYQLIGTSNVPDKHNQKSIIELENCVIGGTFFFKTDVLKQIGGIPLVDYADDAALFERAKTHKLLIAETDAQTYIYHRDNHKSITNR